MCVRTDRYVDAHIHVCMYIYIPYPCMPVHVRFAYIYRLYYMMSGLLSYQHLLVARFFDVEKERIGQKKPVCMYVCMYVSINLTKTYI